MSVLSEDHDAYGAMLRAHIDGRPTVEIIERDDGLIDWSAGPAYYLADFADWPRCEKRAMRHVRGRVLDVGCGAGRAGLYLRGRGHDVVGIDNSPGAVRICRERGLDARAVPVTAATRDTLGVFDSIVMLGNNFGLLGGRRRGRWLLQRFARLTSPESVIVATSRDPYDTDDPDHLDYHRSNASRGRMAGQLRLRVRHGRLATPWFDYLIVSPDEMRDLVAGTGWTVKEVIETGEPLYTAVLRKETWAPSAPA